MSQNRSHNQRGMRKEDTPNEKRKASTERSSKWHKGEGGVDKISQLPNDVLISIISRLTLREAITTSILTKRWRYLYTYITHLIFPTFDPIINSPALLKFQSTNFLNYVNMVNHVLDSHDGGTIVNELKLHMCRMKGASVEKWVEFALTKEIEIIDITMLQPHRISTLMHQCAGGCCSFGLSTLISSQSSQPLPSLKHLKQLTLANVVMTDQDFDLLVSNFFALETLCLECPITLNKVSIVGHPNLKHFGITTHRGLESFEIRNVMNLLSLQIYKLGSECALTLKNIPKLAELYANDVGKQTHQYDELFARIPSCIRDQLQLFHLSIDLACNIISRDIVWQPFQLVNMKQVELVLDDMMEETRPVWVLYPLLEACVWLEKLKIKFVWLMICSEETWDRKAPPYYSHVKKLSPNLKVFEIEQYLGCQADLDLAAHVIYYAVNLEQVTVVACDETKTFACAQEDFGEIMLARAQEDFGEITPHSIHLQISWP